MCDEKESAILAVCLVDFHHKRGPEVEYWHGLPESTNESQLWNNLPFQALPDGSHSFEETFTYFTLLYDELAHCSPPNGAVDLPEDDLKNYTTLFAISCSRQIKTEDLITKDKDVTRSTVQKAIVVISREPIFGQIRDKLSIVTNAYFLQHDFTDKQILVSLYDNLKVLYKTSTEEEDSTSSENRLYVGLCLRRILHGFNKDILVLLKAMLLEKRIIFYGSNVEYLCNLQFGLISLIPSLMFDLQDSGSPLLYKSTDNLKSVDSFKSSDRKSVLRFLGLPLQIFQKGGLFSPYTPLQQLEDIKSDVTKFFIIGSSNSLLYEQRNELCDILVNIDDTTVEIIDKSLNPVLQLTNHDKKWIDSIAAVVKETWNENDDETPKNSQFKGSEDFIRWQFEDYLTGFLSSVKLHDYITLHKDNQFALQSIPEDMLSSAPWTLFNVNFVKNWEQTQSYSIFNSLTDDRLFDLFPPKHAYNGVDNFTIFQQKLVAAFQNLKRPSNTNNTISRHASNDMSSVNSHVDIKTPSISRLSSGKANDEQSQTDNDNDDETINSNKGENVWTLWKTYFNKKKVKNNSEDETPKEDAPIINETTTEDLKELRSTRTAIETALLGLGLKMEHRDSKEDKVNDKEIDGMVLISKDDETESTEDSGDISNINEVD